MNEIALTPSQNSSDQWVPADLPYFGTASEQNSKFLPEATRKEIVDLSRHLHCFFVDYLTTSKEYVKKMSRLFHDEGKGIASYDPGFDLVTCLRFERYFIADQVAPLSNFQYCSGELALRRLLAIATGLQSEIKGEREILFQITHAITQANKSGRLNESNFATLKKVLALAEEIRGRYCLTSLENYSTISSGILRNHFSTGSVPVLLIIGAGYMVQSFFESLDIEVKAVIWLNRNIGKAQKCAESLKFSKIPAPTFTFNSLSYLNQALENSSAVFAATGGGLLFDSIALHSIQTLKVVIDISFPPIFATDKSCNVYTIENTTFEDYMCNRQSKNLLVAGNRGIDGALKELGLVKPAHTLSTIRTQSG